MHFQSGVSRQHSLTLLQQYNTGESIIQVPKVHAAYSTLVVQLTVDIECLVGGNLEFSHSLTGHGSIFQRGVEFIAPGRPVTISVAVVVTEEVVAVCLGALADL